jgi:hypothetical protein
VFENRDKRYYAACAESNGRKEIILNLSLPHQGFDHSSKDAVRNHD